MRRTKQHPKPSLLLAQHHTPPQHLTPNLPYIAIVSVKHKGCSTLGGLREVNTEDLDSYIGTGRSKIKTTPSACPRSTSSDASRKTGLVAPSTRTAFSCSKSIMPSAAPSAGLNEREPYRIALVSMPRPSPANVRHTPSTSTLGAVGLSAAGRFNARARAMAEASSVRASSRTTSCGLRVMCITSDGVLTPSKRPAQLLRPPYLANVRDEV
eukprot:scaffold24237_cov161-Isochrysis_galbana.AAC.3